MEPDQVREKLLQRMAADRAEPPLSRVRSFLQGAFSDADGLDEVRDDLRSLASVNTRSIHLDLAALEQVLVDSTVEQEFSRLVGWDANWVLTDPSNEGAKQFLQQIAALLRDVLDSAPDPWKGAYDLRPRQ